MKRLKIFRVIRDIKNWFFIKNQVKKFKESTLWHEYNLSHDWIYRIICVVNMKKEDFSEELEVHKSRLSAYLRQPLEFLGETMELKELLVIKKYRIDDTYSYLIIFSQRRLALSVPYIISRIVLIGAMIYSILFLI